MSCKYIQELILTDYIDGRMWDKPKSLIDQHLLVCPACKELLSTVKRDVVDPLSHAPQAVADGGLWAQIKQTIQEEERQQVERALVPDFWERLRLAVHIPRPAFALVTIVTMILMIGPTGQLFFNAPVMNLNGGDQVAYISSLINEPMDVTVNNGNDAQTPIEKYFL